MDDTFDLASLDPMIEAQESGMEVDIKGPDGKPLGPNGWRIRIAGPDSKRFREASAAITQERIDSENPGDLSAEDIQKNSIRILAKCTLGWTPIIMGGKEVECSEVNARKIYEKYSFVREQLERKAGNRRAFFRDLGTNAGEQ